MVLADDDRKANDSDAYCHQYFCVPVCGVVNIRPHSHAVHFIWKISTGSALPNFGRRVSIRLQLNRVNYKWPEGYSNTNIDRTTQNVTQRYD